MSTNSSNLLFGVISTASNPVPRCAAAIKDAVIELGKYWTLNNDEARLIAPDVDLGDILSQVCSILNPSSKWSS